MKLDNGVQDQNSAFGGFLTIILTLITLMFTYNKLITLIDKHDVDIMGSLSEGAIEYSAKFTAADDGFYFAAALTEYDSNTESVEDPRFGELVIEHYGWGYSGSIGTKNTTLETHPCSDEELSLKRSSSDE